MQGSREGSITLSLGSKKRRPWVLEQLGSILAVDDLPTDQQADANGIEGDVPFGGGPAEALGQYVAQRTEVDQVARRSRDPKPAGGLTYVPIRPAGTSPNDPCAAMTTKAVLSALFVIP